MKTLRLLPAAAALALACSSDPIQFSQPVGISLGVNHSNVSGTAVSVDKNINTESGNPYGAFVNAAVQKIGKNPSRIAVTGITLQLLGTSSGVTTLGEVFAGAVAISFQMNSGNGTYPVGTVAVDGTTGAGPIIVSSTFNSATMAPGDYDQLVQGSFKVVLEGTATTAFAGSATDVADLETSFAFVAFE